MRRQRKKKNLDCVIDHKKPVNSIVDYLSAGYSTSLGRLYDHFLSIQEIYSYHIKDIMMSNREHDGGLQCQLLVLHYRQLEKDKDGPPIRRFAKGPNLHCDSNGIHADFLL